MGFFVKAVVTGFGLSLGAALFKKHVARRLGLEEETANKKSEEDTLVRDGAAEPGMPT